MVKPMHKSQSVIRLSLTLGLLSLLGVVLAVVFLSPSVSLALQVPTPTPAPAIVLSPISGPSGTRVMVRGYTFTPNDVVLLTWDGNVITPTQPAHVVVDLSGQFQASFYVPTDGQGGHAITAGTAHETATATFTITTGEPPPTSTPLGMQGTPEPTVRPSPTPGPAIVLTPNQGPGGTRVRVQGYNFIGNRTISLYWDGAQIGSEQPITSRPDGYFEGYFTVAANATQGVHQVGARDGTRSAAAPFTVIVATNTPTFTPSPTGTNTPTRTPSPTQPTNTPTNTPTETPTPSPSPTWAQITPGSTWVPPSPTSGTWPTATWAPAPTSAPSAPTATATATLGPGTPSPTGQPKPTKVPDSGVGFGGPGGMIFISGAGLVLAVLLLVFRGLRAKSNL